MHNLVRSKSVRQFSSQKWQISRAIRSKSSNEILSTPLESPTAAAPVVMEPPSPSLNKLANKLWVEMQRMEKASLMELIKTPHFLHDEAEVGNVELIIMITRTYPQLIWEIDANGYTIFHIGIKYRWYSVFHLIPQVGVMIDLNAMSQDQDGNNILHLSAKLAPPHRLRKPQSTQLMQAELQWFGSVEKMVPPSCAEMRNNDGLRPRDLFTREHRSLFEYSKKFMRNTANSFMLIATILLTVVFAVAFYVPGGYDALTGKIAVVASLTSIIMFRSVIAWSYAEKDFLFKLPAQLNLGFFALYISLYATFMAFETSGQPKIR